VNFFKTKKGTLIYGVPAIDGISEKQYGTAISEKHILYITEVVVIGGLFRMSCLFSANFCIMFFCRKISEKPSCEKAFFALVSQKSSNLFK
jgi:hypothetical protein